MRPVLSSKSQTAYLQEAGIEDKNATVIQPQELQNGAKYDFALKTRLGRSLVTFLLIHKQLNFSSFNLHFAEPLSSLQKFLQFSLLSKTKIIPLSNKYVVKFSHTWFKELVLIFLPFPALELGTTVAIAAFNTYDDYNLVTKPDFQISKQFF